ncbi:MAG: methyltransferase domain-containing protein [Candidatus Omnitrophica bacterium]|nr:methyltransferase domain-containing protein [Candidatus Omnitrophota bacterium]
MRNDVDPVERKELAITACRSCRRPSKELTPILSLGKLYVSNFVDPSTHEEASRKVPLDLVLCDAGSGGCGLVQLKHTAPPEWMYPQYWYRSGMNASMLRALADITSKAERLAQPSAGDVVLDVGCNDGTLLRTYPSPGLVRVGFEPAANLVPEAAVGTSKIINRYFNLADFEEHFPGRKAKIVTSIAMFYDLEDPNQFTADVAGCLDGNGIWVVQMSYLPLMLERNAFDNICHEHLGYYSVNSLQHLLKPHGLRVADVELNEVNGGSFRVVISHEKAKGLRLAGGEGRVATLEESERSMGLGSPGIYHAFAARIGKIKDQLVGFIQQEHRRGRRIYVYGASTKGNTLLQFFQLDSRLIRAAAERNPEKWGKRTAGTRIPILSEEQARADQPDYFLVLPWHFLDEFIDREKEYLSRGGGFIVPLPQPQIVTCKGRRSL